MGLIDLLMTILVGGLVGWVASILMKTRRQMGPVAAVLVGIVGSFFGRFLAGLVGLAAVTTLGRVVVGILGAAALIAILKGLRVYK